MPVGVRGDAQLDFFRFRGRASGFGSFSADSEGGGAQSGSRGQEGTTVHSAEQSYVFCPAQRAKSVVHQSMFDAPFEQDASGHNAQSEKALRLARTDGVGHGDRAAAPSE